MDPHLYNIICLTTTSLTFVGNMLLSIPLLVAISRPPSLLRRTRYVLLFHLLCCDNLQLLIQLVHAALLTSRHTMLVTHCVVFISAEGFFVSGSLLLRAALSADCFLAIWLPLRYETLLSPVRQQTAVVLIWIITLLPSIALMCMMLNRVSKNQEISLCFPYMVGRYLSDHRPLTIFYMAVTTLVLPLSFFTVLCSFVLLCCHTKGRLCLQRRACVTLTMQAVQMVIHGVSLIMNSTLIIKRKQNTDWNLAVNIIYILAISLITLVYGYRSKELKSRMPRLQCSQVNTS